MKICHLTSVHKSDDVRIFHKECCSLAKKGYDVFLVAMGDSRVEKGVTVHGVGNAPVSRIKRALFFSKLVYKEGLKINADVYHLHDPELLRYVKKLKRHGKKVIFDSHENTLHQVEEKDWIPSIIRPLFGKIYKRIASRIMSRCSALISVSPEIVNELKSINPNTVMVTNYPVFKAPEIIAKDPGQTKICFTGGISKQWNHDKICQSIKNLNNTFYHIYGSASDSVIAEMNQISGNKVVFHGKVSSDLARKGQQESNIGMAILSPSNNTNGMIGTLGNTKLFEYMGSGIPVICTDFVLWKEIIEGNKCGICVSPDSVDSIRRAIEYLSANQSVCEDMGRRGIETVKMHYCWESQEKVLIELYMSIGGEE